MVVTRKRFGPDHAEMMFAIRAHKRVVAWHWRTPASWIEVQVGEAGTAFYFLWFHKSMKSLTTLLEMSGKRVFDAIEAVLELFDS